jgi:hypothetical protein
MTSGVPCPSCGVYLVGIPGHPWTRYELQATSDPFAASWLRFWLWIDGGGIRIADLYPEPERAAGREAGS